MPFTYLHVFPYSPRTGTAAPDLPNPVPQRIAGERSKELRELAQEKGDRYRAGRSGTEATVVLEGDGGWALTEDYLRVEVAEGASNRSAPSDRLHTGQLQGSGSRLYIDLSQPLSH